MSYLSWIPIGISLVSVVIAVLTYSRNGKKDDKEALQKEDAKFDGIKEGLLKANLKLDTVCTTTTETRADIKSMTKDLINIDHRVTSLDTPWLFEYDRGMYFTVNDSSAYGSHVIKAEKVLSS